MCGTPSIAAQGLRGGPRWEVVGRDDQLSTVRSFVVNPDRTPVLLLSGEAGIGKSTLWEAGLAAAREHGVRVMAARPGNSETHLAFAALLDVFSAIDGRELAAVPAPQRHALEVALLRAVPRGRPPKPQMIERGVLAAVTSLSARGPVLIAIDDVQWLDSPSAEAIAIVAHRLQGSSVGFLLTRRAGSPEGLESRFERASIRRVELGRLPRDAVRRILASRLRRELPPRALDQVLEASDGNPLFALELGRLLGEHGEGGGLAVPHVVDEVLAARVARLSKPARDVLLAVALSPAVPLRELEALAGAQAVEDALAAGAVVADGERVHVAHPLLGAAALRRLSTSERRMLHQRLGGVAGNLERRGHHLASATWSEDASVARHVAQAAASAAARGATGNAAALSDHALRLTPRNDPARVDRLLTLAAHLDVAGEATRSRALLEPELDRLPPGAPRVRAHLLLADGGAIEGVDEYRRFVASALVEAGEDPVLRAPVLARQVEEIVAGQSARLPECEAWALEALAAAPAAGADVETVALHSLGLCRVIRGRPVDDLLARSDTILDGATHVYRSVERLASLRHLWRGEPAPARAKLARLAGLAEARADDWSRCIIGWNLCEADLRDGRWDAAARLLDGVGLSWYANWFTGPAQARCHALLAAGRGDADAAERFAAAALAGAGLVWDALEARRARATAALLRGRPELALEDLRHVWEHTRREGIDEPGAFPVAPDLVEALVGVGELNEAAEVTRCLADLAERQQHPWGRATASRCAALIGFASQADADAAAAGLAAAAAELERLGLRLDHARTLLTLGRQARRRRKWGAARAALEQASAAFAALGSTGWAELAGAELARLPGRRPTDAGELTPTERRVAELAASGLTNKEMAQALSVTVSTIETHLSRVYSKLGISSRGQLAARIARERRSRSEC